MILKGWPITTGDGLAHTAKLVACGLVRNSNRESASLVDDAADFPTRGEDAPGILAKLLQVTLMVSPFVSLRPSPPSVSSAVATVSSAALTVTGPPAQVAAGQDTRP